MIYNKTEPATGKSSIICNDGECSIESNVDILGIEINFRKLKEILGESEEFKNIFADIPVEVLDARKFSQTKNLYIISGLKL